MLLLALLCPQLYLIPFLHQTTTEGKFCCTYNQLYLIPFLHQTTTCCRYYIKIQVLYLIPFLHQTTTEDMENWAKAMLYLIPFLHQTTTIDDVSAKTICCILFHFYIKPQLCPLLRSSSPVVSYSISTSNHNFLECAVYRLVVVSYSISTSNHNCQKCPVVLVLVVSYSISTSNHNTTDEIKDIALLYLIPFLHQTTTPGA